MAPGSGLTGIKESNVSLKAPSNSYIVDLMVSQGEKLEIGQAMLRYRNLVDEYQLQQITVELEQDTRLLVQHEDERCFLVSDQFSASPISHSDYGCQKASPSAGAGGLYILSFYEDYLLEQKFLVDLALERKKKADELYKKRKILTKKRNALRKGKGETIRFYDLETELSDLNTELVSFMISELEAKKKLTDKLMVFQMRRSERLLTLDEQINSLKSKITEKTYQQQLLAEKKKKSVIRSPINGSILELTDGLAVGTFVQEASQMFVLKKEGASQEVTAKFDSRYRHFLNIGREVRLKINSPGFNEIFSGTIVELSSDSIAYDEQNKNGKRYYRVTIKPDQEFLDLSLNLGIDVQVFVVDDKINVMEFIFSVLPSDIKFEVW
ncbi:HlyD family efflux transporter periplasmic adaptor subunit [Vibrio rhodolitus]|uniref:HlyD family efflux transporter periplasmic adaptor subunit n=1 Tax=Vibrio rhodolitus TaxID=2231649 RepID=UPI0013DFE354|nr:HlyD family efflux transporter periplasmic adaptor subunit [Vibrio rhodolitus]